MVPVTVSIVPSMVSVPVWPTYSPAASALWKGISTVMVVLSPTSAMGSPTATGSPTLT